MPSRQRTLFFESPTLYCPNRRKRPPDWRVRDVTEDAPRPAINVQRTCGKRPDHIPKPHEIGH